MTNDLNNPPGSIPPDAPRVSVLVRARNDEAIIGRTLKGIFDQKPPPAVEA